MRKSWLIAATVVCSACSTPPAQEAAKEAAPALGSFARLDPAFDALVPPDAKIEKIAGGYTFIEGPVWRPEGAIVLQSPYNLSTLTMKQPPPIKSSHSYKLANPSP